MTNTRLFSFRIFVVPSLTSKKWCSCHGNALNFTFNTALFLSPDISHFRYLEHDELAAKKFACNLIIRDREASCIADVLILTLCNLFPWPFYSRGLPFFRFSYLKISTVAPLFHMRRGIIQITEIGSALCGSWK